VRDLLNMDDGERAENRPLRRDERPPTVDFPSSSSLARARRRMFDINPSFITALACANACDALDIVVACVACECATDADEAHAARELVRLQRALVIPLFARAHSRAKWKINVKNFIARAMNAKKTRKDALNDGHFLAHERSSASAQSRALALETTDALYYAIAGTSSAKDVLSDANYWMTSSATFAGDAASGARAGDARAHRGFISRADAIAIDASHARARGLGKRLVMCGHSLGGAVAALATVRLLSREPNARVRCVAFALPPIGNAALSALARDRGWCEKVFTSITLPEDRIATILKSRPGYCEFVPTRYILEDGRVVSRSDDSASGAEEKEAMNRAMKESAGLSKPRSAVYAHAMKTYRRRLVAALRRASPASFSDGVAHDDVPLTFIATRRHLGPSPTFIRAVGVLTRDGSRVAALVRGRDIDATTCSRFKATVNGWPCATSATVLSPDALLIIVTPPLLHGAPLPSDSVCSQTDETTWTPLTVGAAGDFSMEFIDVRVISRKVLEEYVASENLAVDSGKQAQARAGALDAMEIEALRSISEMAPPAIRSKM